MRCDQWNDWFGLFRGLSFNPCWVFWCVATFWWLIIYTGSESFNPCWVFWCVATITLNRLNLLLIGFNPCWVFWCVATYFLLITSNVRQCSFNPCWVFWCVATRKRWIHDRNSIRFQSLLGFLMRCDPSASIQLRGNRIVSIPAGFSDALRLHFNGRGWHSSRGFNPCWVFWCVATNTTLDCDEWTEAFQSLLGFLMRCDSLPICHDHFCDNCFNPCWVFWCVATWQRRQEKGVFLGFNPCWVFWCVATITYKRRCRWTKSFNPCWVFWCVATFVLL